MGQTGDIVHRIDQRLRNRNSIIILTLMILAVGIGWINRFVQDDAFISFSYARNLVEGSGLTWFGTRVEGYTNFLWVLWIALGLRIGIEPILWSQLGGLASFALAVYAIWRLSILLFEDSLPAVLAVLFFITNFSAASFATGGLETMFQTALWILSVYVLFRMESLRVGTTKLLLALSLLLAAAVLTRLDSAVPALLIALSVAIHLVRRRCPLRHYVWFTVPFVLIVGTWFLWKLSYYGNVLPNTYFSRADSKFFFGTNGFVYLFRFFHWYLLWPVYLFGTFVWLIKRNRPDRRVVYLVIHIVIWCVYVIAVGGDFMEFRFMVPVAPLLFIVLSYQLYYAFGRRSARFSLVACVAALAILALGSIRHARTFDGVTEDKRLDSVPALATFYGLYPKNDWDRIGKRLQEELRGTSAVVALDAVGAIPYYSRIETVDIWGLNDAYVARHGYPMPEDYRRPSHRRRAPLSYLKERGVNLIIGHPTLIPPAILRDPGSTAPLSAWLRRSIGFSRESVQQITCVTMQIDDGLALLMVYLVRDERLEAVMSKEGWTRRTLTL